MAIENAYSRPSGAVVTVLYDRQRSFKVQHGVNVTLLAKPWESYARILAFGAIDSTNTIEPRVDSYSQRPGGNVGDVAGRIYNTNGGGISLVSVEYSQVGSTGPWLPVTVLSGDPLYSLPAIGTPTGEVFNIPISISDNYTGDIWVKVVINSVLGNTEDADGPFSFVYVNPLPNPPGSLTVPVLSLSGTFAVDWTSGPLATYYELEEATQPDFSDAQQIYSGSDLTFTVEDRTPGMYYYRVRSGNVYGVSDWTEGSNGAEVPMPSMPSAMNVPVFNKTGEYTISWAAVDGADGYELQEDMDSGFANPRTAYNGPETSVTIKRNERGVFYYRVRAWRL